MTTPLPARGLRERNRIRRTRRVERAALELALEHGVEHVTVDMICAASDISPRTYFNYFGTKEGALVGAGPAALDPEAVAAFVEARGPVVEDLLRLVVRSFIASDPDREIFRLRRELLAREPELDSLRIGRIVGKRQATADLVLRRLAHERPDLSPEEAREEAMLVASIVQTAFPVLVRAWLEANGGAFDVDVDASIAAAVDRVRRVLDA